MSASFAYVQVCNFWCYVHFRLFEHIEIKDVCFFEMIILGNLIWFTANRTYDFRRQFQEQWSWSSHELRAYRELLLESQSPWKTSEEKLEMKRSEISKGGAPKLSMSYHELSLLGYKTKPGVVHILEIFQHRPMFRHINGKLSPRTFEWYGWT